jgi:ferritin-like metal-binding protein YciE
MTAISHALAGDEILKNTFANAALENYEIAAYKSLIKLAEMHGDKKALPLLKTTLREEQQMAAWVDRNVPSVTSMYVRQRAREGIAAKI